MFTILAQDYYRRMYNFLKFIMKKLQEVGEMWRLPGRYMYI